MILHTKLLQEDGHFPACAYPYLSIPNMNISVCQACHWTDRWGCQQCTECKAWCRPCAVTYGSRLDGIWCQLSPSVIKAVLKIADLATTETCQALTICVSGRASATAETGNGTLENGNKVQRLNGKRQVRGPLRDCSPKIRNLQVDQPEVHPAWVTQADFLEHMISTNHLHHLPERARARERGRERESDSTCSFGQQWPVRTNLF